MEIQVNIHEAKTELLTSCQDGPVSNQIGVAKGKLKSPDDIDKYNDEIAELFKCN